MTFLIFAFFYGVYPDELRVADIVSIYKKGPKGEVGNYRPISILTAVLGNMGSGRAVVHILHCLSW